MCGCIIETGDQPRRKGLDGFNPVHGMFLHALPNEPLCSTWECFSLIGRFVCVCTRVAVYEIQALGLAARSKRSKILIKILSLAVTVVTQMFTSLSTFFLQFGRGEWSVAWCHQTIVLYVCVCGVCMCVPHAKVLLEHGVEKLSRSHSYLRKNFRSKLCATRHQMISNRCIETGNVAKFDISLFGFI